MILSLQSNNQSLEIITKAENVKHNIHVRRITYVQVMIRNEFGIRHRKVWISIWTFIIEKKKTCVYLAILSTSLKCEDLWVLPCGKNEYFYVISRSRFGASLCLQYIAWVIMKFQLRSLSIKSHKPDTRLLKPLPLWKVWKYCLHISCDHIAPSECRASHFQTKKCSTQQYLHGILKQDNELKQVKDIDIVKIDERTNTK